MRQEAPAVFVFLKGNMMPKPVLDAVAVVATNMAESRAFYALLGFDFEGEGAFASDEHIEPVRGAGEPRLMIDDAVFMEKLSGIAPKPPTHSIFAMLCETPAQVDETVATLSQAGHTILTAPWDAFWGQRYATVCDPDGYRIDLFAELDTPSDGEA